MYDKNITCQRIQGLDSIRFICALFVLFGHYGIVTDSTFFFLPKSICHYLSSAIGLIFNGPAAVIVFFVISGFCIHYSFVKTKILSLPKYYFRRLIRVGIPAMFSAVLLIFFDNPQNVLTDTVLWSVTCELIYYFIYPALLIIRSRIGILKMVLISYTIALITLLLNTHLIIIANNSYVALGKYTWIIGLPSWLLGCHLAETYNKFPTLSIENIWKIRLSIVFIAFLLRILKFHSTYLLSSNTFTLNLFAILIFFWLGLEIKYLSYKNINKPLEWAGSWSYSLYLVHPITKTFLLNIGFRSLGFGQQVDLMFYILNALLLSFIFFLLIERPSHKLAIYVSNKNFIKKIPIYLKYK